MNQGNPVGGHSRRLRSGARSRPWSEPRIGVRTTVATNPRSIIVIIAGKQPFEPDQDAGSNGLDGLRRDLRIGKTPAYAEVAGEKALPFIEQAADQRDTPDQAVDGVDRDHGAPSVDVVRLDRELAVDRHP